MLKKIKRGVKKIMEKGMELGKAMTRSLSSTRNRANVGIIMIGTCIGGVITGVSFVISAYLENGGHLYPQETDSEE